MHDNTNRETTSNRSSVSESSPPLSLDTIFEVLADRHRRFVLYGLVDAPDGVLEWNELLEDVATLEAGIEHGALRRDQVLDTASELHHWHLPVLADVGLVERDERQGTIRYLPHPAVERWVSQARGDELPR